MPRRIVGRRRRSSGNISDGRISNRLASTARKLTAFDAKHQPTPTAAITMPPSAGPAMRAMLKRLELSATAFGSSSRPTIWNVRDWRAGASSTSAVPISAAIT